jgi:hypothetical protein
VAHENSKSPYSYIVASNAKYLPGLNALINSLDTVGNEQDLIVLSYCLPVSYIRAVRDARLSYHIEFVEVSRAEVDWLGEAEVLMRKRYAIPSEVAYGAYCILDADMFFCHNVDQYFMIAERTGLILGCGLEQKRRYGDEHHQYPSGSGHYLIDPKFRNSRDLCCAPLFVGRPWTSVLRQIWDMVNNHAALGGRLRGSEMDALNIVLLAAGSFERTISLSQQIWTGLHESLMKAHTRAVEIEGEAFTEDGQEINVVHGQYWNMNWRRWQLEAQMAMINREFDGSPRYCLLSNESFELLCRWYRRMSCGHKININDFVRYIPSADGPVADVMDIV